MRDGPHAGVACAAAIIASAVPNLGDLVLLLDAAGQLRLAAALRERQGKCTPRALVGVPKPDPEFWRRRADGGAR